jgi:hypothetical protein
MAAMNASVSHLNAARAREEWDVQVDASTAHSRVPDAEYVVRYIEHETLFLFNSGKVVLRFEIVESDEHSGSRLLRPYRVKKLLNRPCKGGRFQLGRSSELLRDIVRLTESTTRPDRASLGFLRGRLWRVRTRTVATDYQQRPIPEPLRYSVIAEILRAETG